MLMNFNEFILNEKLDLDIIVKVENSNNQEFLNKIVDDFTLRTGRRTLKNVRPKKITGHLQKEELHPKKTNNRSTLNIVMNNGHTIVGTYNTSTFNVVISINNEKIYDIHIKGCDDNKLLDKMKSEYLKYLKNKGYQVKIYENYKSNDFIYHGTGKGQALNIQRDGFMKPKNTGEEKPSISFTNDLDYAKYYAKSKGGVYMTILRTKLDEKFKLSPRIRNNKGDEYVTFEKIFSSDLELMTLNNGWQPLNKWNVVFDEPL